MATAQTGQFIAGQRVIDPALSSDAGKAGTSNVNAKIFAATKDISSMKAALTTWQASTYTTARLNAMSHNDLLSVILNNATAIAAVLP